MLSRRRVVAWSVALALLQLAGCVRDDRRDAEEVLARHFELVARRNYNAALDDYDDKFFEDVSRPDWRSALINVTEKLGVFQSYNISVHGLESKVIAGPGTYLKYKCDVRYARHPSVETFFLFRRQGATKFKILGHEIDADGLATR